MLHFTPLSLCKVLQLIHEKEISELQIVSARDKLIVWPTAQLVRGCLSFKSWLINYLCGSKSQTQ